MNILFLTTAKVNNINEPGIYTDLFKEFKNKGHNVYMICPVERKYNEKTTFIFDCGINVLKVWSLNIQKTNIIEKGVSMLILGLLFKFSIKKYINISQIDLIIYSTPPVTFNSLINYFKKNSKAKTYLLLKDIFPQNAVDLGLIKKTGVFFKYFRQLEINLYEISDFIGCMSPANRDYLLLNNLVLDPKKVEVNPNSIDVKNLNLKKINKDELINKYDLPENKVIFLYGGNLGKPQGVEYITRSIDYCKNLEDAFFVIIGSGTESHIVKNWIKEKCPKNVKLLNEIPVLEYEELLQIADVGLIFLNPEFTIPNFPSRVLSYMKHGLPILCSIDNSSDIGEIAIQNNFGLSGSIKNLDQFYSNLVVLLDIQNRKVMGKNSFNFLINNYSVESSCNSIINKFQSNSYE
jgi:glycosyltransferase involved in cell wall biosynthesis